VCEEIERLCRSLWQRYEKCKSFAIKDSCDGAVGGRGLSKIRIRLLKNVSLFSKAEFRFVA
jgi:hypothetical protein